MTTLKIHIPNKGKNFILSSLLLLAVILISCNLSDEISLFVKDGLRLSFYTVVGSIFPFLILTDLIVAVSEFEKIAPLRKLFEKIFKINGRAVQAYVLGLLCGFPVGVKVATELYKTEKITKEECERLIGFSNNTGPAFIISGVGYSLLKSVKVGIAIYAVMILSSFVTGVLIGKGKKPSKISNDEKKSEFNISNSVKNASLHTLYICGYVVLFSVLIGLLKIFIKNDLIFTLLLPFTEVSNAVKRIAESSDLNANLKLMLTSFSVCFSGTSVHLQAKSFVNGSGLSMKTYYFSKILQGIIAIAITFVVCFLHIV